MRRSGVASTTVVGVIVLLAPGQGSQTPGMLLPWLELAGASADLATWSEAAGLDLLQLGTEADADAIRDTAVAQPLLTAAALLSARALDVVPDAVCGHSIGELAALAVAGVLDPTTAVRLAAERGRAMAVAAAAQPTGMVAVLGGDAAEVLAAAAAHGLEVATVNVAGQVVLGGPVAALDALAAAPPAAARVRRLETAGAFHTSAMAPAVPRLAELVAATTPGQPVCTVVANADGAVVTDGRELLDRLVGQLTGPVRFDLCLQALAGLAPTQVIELAPGGTLAAVAKRALPGVPVLALKTPADLPTKVSA
jgi:[acyl-carrier-protein] S-malonyltransferase